MKKGKYISHLHVINTETAEEKGFISRQVGLSGLVGINGYFVKCYDRGVKTLDSKHLSKLIKLRDFIEYGTNRLVRKHAGKKTIALKQSCLAEILKVDRRTISSMISDLKKHKAVFRINGHYYINPTFIATAKEYHVDIIFEMIKKDPIILKYIDPYQRKQIKEYMAIDDMEW